MTARTDSAKFNVPGGWTAVPNWIFDRDDLTAVEREVLWALYRSAPAKSLKAKIGAAYIAKRFQRGRKTVTAALQSVARRGFILPLGERSIGDAQPYELVLDPPPETCSSPHLPVLHNASPCVPEHIIQKQTKDYENHGREAPHYKYITDSVPPSPSFSYVESAGGSAELPGFGVQLIGPHGDGHGAEGDDGSALGGRCDSSSNTGSFEDWAAQWDAEATAAEAARPKPVPAKQMTKQLVNDALLTPEGLRASDDIDDLQCDAYILVGDVCGQWSPNTWPSLESLTRTHGVRYVAFWTRWLARKIADEYTRGRPVEKPTALLLKAIEGKWEVNPDWPEFNEELHTWKAVESRGQVERRHGVADFKDDYELVF